MYSLYTLERLYTHDQLTIEHFLAHEPNVSARIKQVLVSLWKNSPRTKGDCMHSDKTEEKEKDMAKI